MSQGFVDIDLYRYTGGKRTKDDEVLAWRERRGLQLNYHGEVYVELKINGERILLPVLEMGAGGLRIGVNLTNLVNPTHVARDRFVDQEIGS